MFHQRFVEQILGVGEVPNERIDYMSKAIRRTAAFVLAFGGFAACANHPTAEECKAGITRMMEIQIDAMDAPGSATSEMMRADLTEEQRKSTAQFLKAAIPSQLRPAVVAQCVDRMKRTDLQCTMSASTPEELVQKCHWKPVSGPRGAALGF
jgi:hypothetical protein